MNDAQIVAPVSRAKRNVSTRQRFEIFKRDEFTCQYCGGTPPRAVLHVDHVIAIANGGTNDDTNLVTACSLCNMGKGAVRLEKVGTSLVELAKQTAEREAQIAGFTAVMEARRARIEASVWDMLRYYWNNDDLQEVARVEFQSMKRFVEHLPSYEIKEAADIAWAKRLSMRKTWLYFCKVCWNKIKGVSHA